MHNQQPTHKQYLHREKALYRYANALERGDVDTLAAILHDAEYDAVLERLLIETHEAYLLEKNEAGYAKDAALVHQLLRQHIPSGFEDLVGEAEIPPLTISDVVARLQSDSAVQSSVKQEITTIMQQLHQNATPLPESLSIRGVRTLFTKLGVSVSDRFQKLFRETAIFLSMGREQGIAQLAATRRQQQQMIRQKPEQQQSVEEHQSEAKQEEQ